MLPTFTYKDIRSWRPCYDPINVNHDKAKPGISRDWSGTALDFLRLEQFPMEDRLWVVLRPACIDEKTLRLFAVWCAERALELVENPDPRSVNACKVARRFANGKATKDELAAARAAAWDAARDAAWDAARDAAWAAARAAARDAAWDARDAANKKQVRKLIQTLEKIEG